MIQLKPTTLAAIERTLGWFRDATKRQAQRDAARDVSTPLRVYRDNAKALLQDLGYILRPPARVPPYRPFGKCPSGGFERKVGELLRLARLNRGPLSQLSEPQYVVLCNVWAQALGEMLEGFTRRGFDEASGTMG